MVSERNKQIELTRFIPYSYHLQSYNNIEHSARGLGDKRSKFLEPSCKFARKPQTSANSSKVSFRHKTTVFVVLNASVAKECERNAKGVLFQLLFQCTMQCNARLGIRRQPQSTQSTGALRAAQLLSFTGRQR